jgi:hypothetical protein
MAPHATFFLDEFWPFVGIEEISDLSLRRIDRLKRDADRSFSGTAIVHGPVTRSDATFTIRANEAFATAPPIQSTSPNREERRAAAFGRIKKAKR